MDFKKLHCVHSISPVWTVLVLSPSWLATKIINQKIGFALSNIEAASFSCGLQSIEATENRKHEEMKEHRLLFLGEEKLMAHNYFLVLFFLKMA